MLLGMLKNKLDGYLKVKLDGVIPPGIVVEEPRNRKFGDLSTNAAMVLAPVMKKNPMEMANVMLSDKLMTNSKEGKETLTFEIICRLSRKTDVERPMVPARAVQVSRPEAK